MPVGMFKNVDKSTVCSLLNTLYVRRHIDGYLQPFYNKFFEANKEAIIASHELESSAKASYSEPEYFVGALEIAYRQLLELFEMKDIHYAMLEDYERESLPYRRSTK